jgi:type III pantothenate kinase
MTPDVVVDIGNSRVKWGRCVRKDADWVTVPLGQVEDPGVGWIQETPLLGYVSLPLGDLDAWETQAEAWRLNHTSWAIGGVNPPQLELFSRWLNYREDEHVLFSKATQIPIKLNVDEPEAVGTDRAFAAVAAKSLRDKGEPAIVVDVGTAVTVDLVDADGVFQGGAILPGIRLMARALREYTEKLPLVDISGSLSQHSPGKNTRAAITLGIGAAIAGGINRLVQNYLDDCSSTPWCFLTGGGSHLIEKHLTSELSWESIPGLVLEGIRIAAEALP